MPENTVRIRSALPELLERHGIQPNALARQAGIATRQLAPMLNPNGPRRINLDVLDAILNGLGKLTGKRPGVEDVLKLEVTDA